jgi:plasmid stabilization system protein ParE
MNLPLVFGPQVQHDVDSAYEWYEKERPGLGERLLAAIRVNLARVQTDPHHFAVIYRRVRAALVETFPYVVYFRIERTRLFVLAILHGHRDPAEWQRRN